MLSPLISKILMGVVAALLIVVGVLGYLYKVELETTTKLQIEVDSLSVEYESVRNDLVMKDANMKIVNEGMRKVAIEFMNKEQELQALKKMKYKLIQEPEKAAKAIQEEVDTFIQDINDITTGVVK